MRDTLVEKGTPDNLNLSLLKAASWYLMKLDVSVIIKTVLSRHEVVASVTGLARYYEDIIDALIQGQEPLGLRMDVRNGGQSFLPEEEQLIRKLCGFYEGLTSFLRTESGYIILLPFFKDFLSTSHEDYVSWVRSMTVDQLEKLRPQRGGA